MKHLWEYDHPYFCEEGNYYKNGYDNKFDSWEEFASPGNLLHNGDMDLNLLFRWDWIRAERDDHFGSDGKPFDGTGAEWEKASAADTLLLFFMYQRKACNGSAQVTVTEADEPAVREWLAARASHMTLLWEPFFGGVDE